VSLADVTFHHVARAGLIRATRDDDDRHDVLESRGGHEGGGQSLVATAHQDCGVEHVRIGVYLNHARDELARGQRVVHPVMPLGDAVADV